jgi:hypothetical protein
LILGNKALSGASFKIEVILCLKQRGKPQEAFEFAFEPVGSSADSRVNAQESFR